MQAPQSIRELLEGYKRYNAWESEERQRILPQLSLADGLQQYFDLQALARVFAPEAEAVFLKQRAQHWMALHTALSRAAEYFAHAATARSAEGN